MGCVQDKNMVSQIHLPAEAEPPFMQTEAADGTRWTRYVRGANIFVDAATGLLAGPWAECIAAGVRFERSAEWTGMPEYAGRDGPVAGILVAFEASLKDRANSAELLEAAGRLEEACHAAFMESRPLPGLRPNAEGGLMEVPRLLGHKGRNDIGGPDLGIKTSAAADGGAGLGLEDVSSHDSAGQSGESEGRRGSKTLGVEATCDMAN